MSRVIVATIRAVGIAVLLSLGAAGCWGGRNHVRGYDCSELAKIFFRKPIKTTIAEFGDYDVEKQYAIYICGNQYMHPPMIHLAEPFASEGEKIVDFLKARLLEADDDLTVRDIVVVFAEMRIQKTYNVAGDGDLMEIMQEKVNNIKNPDWRRLVEQDLNEIQK